MKMYKFKCIVFLALSIVTALAFLCVTYIKVSYPIAYSNKIENICGEYSVDENLVRAIINVESGYNELAVSRVGAKGLMQIMPETANWIAGQIGIENFNEKMLFEAETNIKMGVFYLRYLFDKYGEQNLVLFAYNAGEGRLENYLTNEKPFVVEDVMIDETRNYIKKVNSNYKVYNKLFSIVKMVLI